METIDMATDNPHNGNGTADSPFESARKAFNDTAASFTSQAEAKARDYAAEGKDRAVEALDGVAGLVGDAAAQVSERLGDQYGGYVQQAADAVSGFANTLREKDADELARNVVRSSPAIAIAAAAAVGFLLARVVKSGFAPKADNDEPVVPAPAKPSTARKAAPKKPAAPKAAAPKAAAKPAAKKPAKSAAPEAPLVDTPIADTPAPDSPPAV
jgi:ElaB/YqjD/DUF883 family membrane-anchored ribosome-binding protein